LTPGMEMSLSESRTFSLFHFPQSFGRSLKRLRINSIGP
jgi:hypothetical protein